nr:G protein-coupled receptor [Proales similis]
MILSSGVLIFLVSTSVVGTLGNLMVLTVYWQKSSKRTSSFFILVLAFSDLAVCLLLIPITVWMESIYFATSSLLLCKLFFFLTTTIVPSSSMLMSAIAFDRYFCICKVDKNVMSLGRAKLTVLLIVIASVSFGVIPTLSSTIISVTDHTNSSHEQCTVDIDAEHTMFGKLIGPFKIVYDMLYASSVLIITILYALIYKELYKRRRAKRNRRKELILEAYRSERFDDVSSTFATTNINSISNAPTVPANALKIKYSSEDSYLLLEKICNQNLSQMNQKLSEADKNKLQTAPAESEAVDEQSIKSGFNTRTIPFLILIKETQTALTLFVVSIVFIASYLPSILATRSYLPNDNLFIIYLYFVNSAANPLIYSFLNRSFRADLMNLFVKKPSILSISRISTIISNSSVTNCIPAK